MTGEVKILERRDTSFFFVFPEAAPGETELLTIWEVSLFLFCSETYLAYFSRMSILMGENEPMREGLRDVPDSDYR
jgi:hypothetical protein